MSPIKRPEALETFKLTTGRHAGFTGIVVAPLLDKKLVN